MSTELNKLKDKQSIAIMGGTFDPIHYGHLVTAEMVRDRFFIDMVLFIPSGRPPHKNKSDITDFYERFFMTTIATATNDFFHVSDLEIKREGYTYTIDTIKYIKSIAPRARLYFITGADAITQILEWKNADSLLKMCEFIAVSRPGYKKSKLHQKIDYLRNFYNSTIHYMEIPSLAISSTDIRERVANGSPIKYLLPEVVESYIKKRSLYKKENYMDMENMRRKLKDTMSMRRYIHTLGVVDEAVALSLHFKLDVDKARIAALLHDCAKNIPYEEQIRLCKKYAVQLDDIQLKQPELIHPFLGAELAKNEYGVYDEDILDAIRYHTTGRKKMSMLEKIIYLADYIEPNRKNLSNMDKIRKLSYKSLDEAMILTLKSTIDYISENENNVLHPLTRMAYNYYCTTN